MFLSLQDKFDLDQIIPLVISKLATMVCLFRYEPHITSILPKINKNPKLYKYYFNEIIAPALPRTQINIDASIIDQKVITAIICGDTEIQLKLSNK